MMTRIALLMACLASPALAQTPSPQPPVVAAATAQSEIVRVVLDTEAGRIVLALDKGRAPVTTANFLRYVDSKRMDGINFYRAMKLWEGTGLVQAGVRDGAKLYPPIAHEPTSQTGLKHEEGTISMARTTPGSAQGDFFITIGKIDGFDAGGKDDDGLGFAAFGKVVEGMDVVRKLLAAPVSPTKGAEHGMQGQMLEPPVKVLSARRVEE